MTWRRGTREALFAAVAGSLVGAALVGAHGDASFLHGCHPPDGVVRLIPPPELDDASPCQPGEILDEWVVRGTAVDGPPGPRGPQGAAGPDGPPGRDGRPGPSYSLRIVRHSIAANASAPAAATARCDAGELVVSGGWDAGAGATVRSAGRSGASAWTVRASGAKRGLSAYVICARAVNR